MIQNRVLCSHESLMLEKTGNEEEALQYYSVDTACIMLLSH